MGLRQMLGLVKKGIFESFKARTPKHERPDWTRFNFQQYSRRFDQYYTDHTDVKAAVLTIAGVLTAEGIFVKAAGDYDRAKEAAEKIEQFNKRTRIDSMIYETAIRLTKYGTCFWEKDFSAVHGLNIQLIPHQEHMRPHFTNIGEIDRWKYTVHQMPKHSWTPQQVCVFPWNVTTNPPFGTSLLTGIDLELNLKHDILKNLGAYLENAAFASNVLQVGDGQYMPTESQVTDMESKVRNREVGEDFLTTYPTDVKVMGSAQIETRMIPDTLEFTQERITDAMLVPPISKLYNSTEASAKVMSDWCRSVAITPMQRLIAQVIEEQVYTPYLEDMGFSVRVVPELAFEPPDKWINQMAEDMNLTELVASGILSRKAAAELLGLGEEYERDNMDAWEPPAPQFQNGDEEEGGKSWLVNEVNRRGKSHSHGHGSHETKA